MKLKRQRLIFGLYMVVLIAAASTVIGYFALPAWPALMVLIFFFMEDMDPKKAPQILVGSVAGIGAILLARPVISGLAPLTGAELARLLFVAAIVVAIVAAGAIVSMPFGNYAFMFLIVSGLAIQLPEPNPLQWMAIATLGGGLLIAAAAGITRMMIARALRRTPLRPVDSPAVTADRRAGS